MKAYVVDPFLCALWYLWSISTADSPGNTPNLIFPFMKHQLSLYTKDSSLRSLHPGLEHVLKEVKHSLNGCQIIYTCFLINEAVRAWEWNAPPPIWYIYSLEYHICTWMIHVTFSLQSVERTGTSRACPSSVVSFSFIECVDMQHMYVQFSPASVKKCSLHFSPVNVTNVTSFTTSLFWMSLIIAKAKLQEFTFIGELLIHTLQLWPPGYYAAVTAAMSVPSLFQSSCGKLTRKKWSQMLFLIFFLFFIHHLSKKQIAVKCR